MGWIGHEVYIRQVPAWLSATPTHGQSRLWLTAVNCKRRRQNHYSVQRRFRVYFFIVASVKISKKSSQNCRNVVIKDFARRQHVPPFRLSTARRRLFSVSASVLCNSLSSDVQSSLSLRVFRQQRLKSLLFHESFPTFYYDGFVFSP